MKPPTLSIRQSERRDCSVIALSSVSGASYEEVHALLKKWGRRNRCGWHTTTQNVQWALNELGWETKNLLARGARTKMPQARFLTLAYPGRYILCVPGHMFSVIDGASQDSDFFSNKRVDIFIYARRAPRLDLSTFLPEVQA